MTLGSLFDGIGGFPLAAQKCGITPIWAAEIEPFCIAVSHFHFPQMQHYGDVTKIDGGKIPPVDIISFGSPCQDLSIAGNRKGLQGSRSSLFYEAVRIIYEMREATNGRCPAYILWENVAGAFSSNGGRDFQAVLRQITKTDISMPASGKWANAGVVRGEGICVAWRLFDAKYWGVPQRRKRVYLVGSFGSQCAEEISFKPESLCWDIAESRKARGAVAYDTKKGIGAKCNKVDTDCSEKKCFGFDGYNGSLTDDVSATLGVNCGMSTGRNGVVFALQGNITRNSGQHSAGINVNECFTLTAVDRHAVVYDARGNGNGEITPTITGDRDGRVSDYTAIVCQSAGFKPGAGAKAGSVGFEKEKSPTVVSSSVNAVVAKVEKCFSQDAYSKYSEAKQSAALKDKDESYNGGSETLICATIGNGQVRSLGLHDTCGTLTCMHDPEKAITKDGDKWIVQRLMPLECERLQGFPDNWTVLPKIEDMSDSDYKFFKEVFLQDKEIRGKAAKPPTKEQIIKWYNHLDNDGNRYKAIGNSLALPNAFYCMSGISEREAKRNDVHRH